MNGFKSLSKARSSFLVLLAAAGIALCLNGAGDTPLQTASLRPKRIETLPNGVRVAWFEDATLPLFSASIFVEGLGMVYDPPGKSGASSWLATALPRGTAGRGYLEWVTGFEERAVSKVVSSQERFLVFHSSGLSIDAPFIVAELRKLLLEPNLDVSEMERERVRLLEQWEHLEEYPNTLLGVVFGRVLAASTPLGRGAFFSWRELDALAAPEVRARYFAALDPARVFVVLVGRPEYCEALTKELAGFGNFRVQPALGVAAPPKNLDHFDKRLGLSKASERSRRAFVLDRPELTQASIRIGWPLAFGKPGTPEAKAGFKDQARGARLRLANAVLGEMFESRLNKLIRDELGLTYGISSVVDLGPELSVWTIETATQNASVTKVLESEDGVLAAFRKSGLTPKEFEQAQAFLQGIFPLTLDTIEEVAAHWTSAWLVGMPESTLETYLATVKAQTLEGVNREIAEQLRIEERVISIAGNVSAMGPEFGGYLKKAGRSRVAVPSAAILTR